MNESNRPGAMVHLLWFAPNGPDNDDDSLLIGVYETEVAALEAVQRLSNKPGFVDYPEGFQIHPRELGRDSWVEGFIKD
jgi:hypothetical protein